MTVRKLEADYNGHVWICMYCGAKLKTFVGMRKHLREHRKAGDVLS